MTWLAAQDCLRYDTVVYGIDDLDRCPSIDHRVAQPSAKNLVRGLAGTVAVDVMR
jgi:hypothetical protein